jgi:hypothetical protein
LTLGNQAWQHSRASVQAAIATNSHSGVRSG